MLVTTLLLVGSGLVLPALSTMALREEWLPPEAARTVGPAANYALIPVSLVWLVATVRYMVKESKYLSGLRHWLRGVDDSVLARLPEGLPPIRGVSRLVREERKRRENGRG